MALASRFNCATKMSRPPWEPADEWSQDQIGKQDSCGRRFAMATKPERNWPRYSLTTAHLLTPWTNWSAALEWEASR